MERKVRIKRAKILIVIAVIAVAGYFTYTCIKNNQKKWSRIEQNYVDDFDGDGEPEMLIIYGYHKKKSAMKLVDIPSGETIWKSSCHPSHIHEAKRILVSDSVLVIAYYDYINTPYRDDYSKDYIGVEGFNCKTGEQLWDVEMNPENRFSLFFYLAGDEDNILFHSVNFEKDLSYLTSIAPQTGEILWEKGVPAEFLSNPSPIKQNVVLLLGCNDSLYKMDIETGQLIGYKTESSVREVYRIDDTSFYAIERSVLYKYGSQREIVLFNSDTVNINKDTSKYFSYDAMYKKSIIAISNNYHENRAEIKAFPFDSTGVSYSYIFNDGSINAGLYWDLKGREPSQCGFHNLETRYVPFIKERKIDSIKEAKQIIIFDLEKGEPIWHSYHFIKEGFGLYAKDIFYYKKHFLICFETNKDNNLNYTFIVIDGESGKFKKSVTFKPDNLYATHFMWKGFDKFYGNYFYGRSSSVAWCLSFPEMKLVYSTVDSLSAYDNKQELESILGKIPWSN